MEFWKILPSYVTCMFPKASSYLHFLQKKIYDQVPDTVIRTMQSLHIHLLALNSMNSPLQPCWSLFLRVYHPCVYRATHPTLTHCWFPVLYSPLLSIANSSFWVYFPDYFCSCMLCILEVLFIQHGQRLAFLASIFTFSYKPEFLHRFKAPYLKKCYLTSVMPRISNVTRQLGLKVKILF